MSISCMWFIRAIVVAAAFLMLICSSESKPQGASDVSGLGNADFLAKLTGVCDKKCIPMENCCDISPNDNGAPNLDGLVNPRTTVDIGKQELACGGDLLQLCCEKKCNEKKNIGKSLDRSNECGIRNSNGIGVTIKGFQDGQAQYGEFPWMVAVYTQAEKYVGGGSLVHKRVVLSAGHKIHDQELNKAKLVARLGEWDNAKDNEPIPPQNINVVKIIYHDSFYRPSHEYNVALLFLENDAVLSDTVLPICLPAPDQVFATGTDCIVTGWGKDKLGGKYQTIMKAATVPAMGNIQCEAMLRGTRLGTSFDLHESFNCAGGTKEDACEGDGGSPLVCPNPNNSNEYVQMGIVSWGIGCGIEGNPGVYASIPKTVKWINKAIDTEINFTSLINERVKPLN